ncbi:MAG: SDR family NAD(P)-dependent oxidoreductase [Anaerolineae bacterium]|nr:SDR family NAD(P)-dependent oxidoreductase [Anaerolineae bacterium]
MTTTLKGKVAIVTGASRGIGKGIALSLGAAGATVYVTGRTDSGHPAKVPLAGTVEETAAEVTALGGTGIAVRCDHRHDSETEALFQRVKDEQKRLDVLVNSAWAGYEGLHDGSDFPLDQPFWARQVSKWDDNLFGVRSAYVASVHAIRMMVEQQNGLIVHVSHKINEYGNPAYHIAKTATDRLAAEMAPPLKAHGIAVVALYPGLVRTEGIMKHAEFMDLSNSESPQFTGRAVAALGMDSHVLAKTGQALWVSDLAAEYGFTDVDGKVYIPTWK